MNNDTFNKPRQHCFEGRSLDVVPSELWGQPKTKSTNHSHGRREAAPGTCRKVQKATPARIRVNTLYFLTKQSLYL